MITLILLMIIYLAFISLGLPDALLGVAWPLVRQEWMMGLDAAGIISIVVTVGTISSSLLSGKLIKRFGEGKITLMSGLLTGFALLGYSLAPSFIWFIFLALPLGFGAGSVDTALNHFVATHFKAHHMNWLHSFWGVGATAGPLLMGFIIASTGSWRKGYLVVALIQLFLAAIIFLSLPLWKRHATEQANKADEETEVLNENHTDSKRIFLRPGVPFALLIFMVYCAGEFAMGLWGASYLVQKRALTLNLAASWVGLYYAGITVGRILAGFISFKLSNKQLITLGILIALAGSILLVGNISDHLSMMAFILIGLGFAPIFPSMVHETPKRFGNKIAQSVIGYQMASAYVGIAVFPPLLGVVMQRTSIGLYPVFMLACVILLGILTVLLNRATKIKT
ncbi:MFS transporter [Fusibacter bizertensis]|uniref:MFS transporter n=1 Tax=Fusibacter bizertensis TaxID=1488331 RepID=A0ABT6NH07_9FIRM|nr:MFS transporter [Fusibacter bizertensis]MDH8679691.1 MFS transporter [Fusibacter bizertensis]